MLKTFLTTFSLAVATIANPPTMLFELQYRDQVGPPRYRIPDENTTSYIRWTYIEEDNVYQNIWWAYYGSDDPNNQTIDWAVHYINHVHEIFSPEYILENPVTTETTETTFSLDLDWVTRFDRWEMSMQLEGDPREITYPATIDGMTGQVTIVDSEPEGDWISTWYIVRAITVDNQNADFNNDGVVNGLDVAGYLERYSESINLRYSRYIPSHWPQEGYFPRVDSNNDGQIDSMDVGIFLSRYAEEK